MLNESSYGPLTLNVWERCGSQVIAKNEFGPMRFQYSLIVNILLID